MLLIKLVRISGFTILRSAVRLDDPFEASLGSLLPLLLTNAWWRVVG